MEMLINGRIYKKLIECRSSYFDYEETNTNWQDYIPVLYQEYPYYIRESEDASKLYFFLENKEYLVSDMNLQVGDKFQVPEIWQYLRYEDSLTVDSVYTKNELKHIQFGQIFILPEGAD